MSVVVSVARYAMKPMVSRYTRAIATAPIAVGRPAQVSSPSWGFQAKLCASAAQPDSSHLNRQRAPTRYVIFVRLAVAWCSAERLANPTSLQSTQAHSTIHRHSIRQSRSSPATVQFGLSYLRTSGHLKRSPHDGACEPRRDASNAAASRIRSHAMIPASALLGRSGFHQAVQPSDLIGEHAIRSLRPRLKAILVVATECVCE
jgi:hypothetical protein